MKSSETLPSIRPAKEVVVVVNPIKRHLSLSSQYVAEQGSRKNNVFESGERYIVRLSCPQIGWFICNRISNIVVDKQFEISDHVFGFSAATIFDSQFKPARIVESSPGKTVDFGAVEHNFGLFGKFQNSLCSGRILGRCIGELFKTYLVLPHNSGLFLNGLQSSQSNDSSCNADNSQHYCAAQNSPINRVFDRLHSYFVGESADLHFVILALIFCPAGVLIGGVGGGVTRGRRVISCDCRYPVGPAPYSCCLSVGELTPVGPRAV